MFEALWWRASSSHEANAEVLWLAAAAHLELRYVAGDDWTAARDADWLERLTQNADIIYRLVHESGRSASVFQLANALVLTVIDSDGDISISSAAPSHDEALAAIKRVREAVPELGEAQGARVMIKLWSCGPHGPTPRTKVLEVPPWSSLAANYSRATRAVLEGYVRDIAIGSGKLALWLGPPGTGKTPALRALAWEQRATVRLHYVLDPEKDSEFFVVTSFNWLSFRGDPRRPFREEWGTLVRDPALVEEFYQEMLKRFV
jgi:hypothetical protein